MFLSDYLAFVGLFFFNDGFHPSFHNMPHFLSHHSHYAVWVSNFSETTALFFSYGETPSPVKWLGSPEMIS
jgi:hypothetical protein